MKGRTHLAAGVITGLLFSSHLDMLSVGTLSVTACAAFGSLLPDVDTATSKLGRIFPPASALVKFIFGHRTVFHSPLLYFVLGYFLYRTFPEQSLLFSACLLGVETHLILDMLNPAGIPLLWPVKKRFRIASMHSGGFFDNFLCCVLWMICFCMILTRLI